MYFETLAGPILSGTKVQFLLWCTMYAQARIRIRSRRVLIVMISGATITICLFGLWAGTTHCSIMHFCVVAEEPTTPGDIFCPRSDLFSFVCVRACKRCSRSMSALLLQKYLYKFSEFCFGRVRGGKWHENKLFRYVVVVIVAFVFACLASWRARAIYRSKNERRVEVFWVTATKSN